MDIRLWSIADDLAVAVGGRDADVSEVVRRANADAVVDLLVEEIASRAIMPANTAGIPIRLEIESGREVLTRILSFVGGVLQPGNCDEDPNLVALRYRIEDLVRSIYRTREQYQSSSRQVRLPFLKDSRLSNPEERTNMRGKFDGTLRVMQAVVSAITDIAPSLAELAVRFQTDKWGFLHWYMPHYHKHFQGFRFEPVRVLEIGVGGYDNENSGGGSLFMWQQYFPRGLIYGIDIFPKRITGPRVKTVVCDQGDTAGLDVFASEHGPFDVIIDDGSHLNDQVRASFETLFPYVKPGGYYAIEDIQTSYWPEFGGDRPPVSSNTTMGFIKDLLDQIHMREYDDIDDDAAWRASHPSEIYVTHNLAFLAKGINHEAGAPMWLRESGAT